MKYEFIFLQGSLLTSHHQPVSNVNVSAPPHHHRGKSFDSSSMTQVMQKSNPIIDQATKRVREPNLLYART